ncbi:MAG TPA: hypothetical protein VE968_06850 [Sphingomicrobium sp.]|nr:hypothetical protein [Sphingomicrobium sp.]
MPAVLLQAAPRRLAQEGASFTRYLPNCRIIGHSLVNGSPALGRFSMVGGIAIAMFVALVGWGGRYFGWEDPEGKVQLALITSFILGIIGGFKARS